MLTDVTCEGDGKTSRWLLQLVLWLLAVLSVTWALQDPRFRDAEGSLQGACCLPLATGAALFVLGWAVTKPWRRAACWFALALVGQAVALQLIDAGPTIHYQHYKPIDRLLAETNPVLYLYLLVQTGLVIIGLGRHWRAIRAWLGRTFKAWQLVGIALAFFLTSATVSASVADYAIELVVATFIQAVNLGNIVLVAWAFPQEKLSGLQRIFDVLLGKSSPASSKRPGGIDRFVLAAALWVTILAALLNVLSYERHPHVPDEALYLYQARYLSTGRLTVPAPPVPEAFSFYLVPYRAAQWYSIFPPGWPAMLAVGVLAGVPWLVNPLLSGLNVVLAYILLQEAFERRTARLVVLLLCASPWFIFMGMNFMAHTFTLTCALIAALGVARARRTAKVGWACLAGCATGVVSLIRPLDGLITAGLLGLWLLLGGGWRNKAAMLAAFVLGAAGVGALVLPYNSAITGDPTTFPLTQYYEEYFGPKANALGFGPERGLGWAIDPFPGHSPLDAFINADLNTFMLNVDLFGWSTGSLILIAVLLLSWKLSRRDYAMVAVVVGVIVPHSLYWFSGGPDFGARYWYLMLVPLVILAVRGIQFLTRALDDPSASSSTGGTRVMIGVLALCALTLVAFFPWRAIDKYHHYRGMRPDILRLAQEYGFGKSLVLVRGDEADYLSAWTYNPLDPDADAPIYAWDRSPEVRAQLLEAYSDRTVWVVDGPTETGGGYTVVAGPLSTLAPLLETADAP